jgi:hypothetical protein
LILAGHGRAAHSASLTGHFKWGSICDLAVMGGLRILSDSGQAAYIEGGDLRMTN